MKNFFENFIPKSRIISALSVGVLTSLLLVGLINLAYIFPKDAVFLYGLAMFCGIPFFVGVLTTVTLGCRNKVSISQGIGYSLLALLLVGLSLLFFAIEGVICLVMAAPIVAIFTVIGSLIGYNLQKVTTHSNTNVFGSFIVFLFFLPSMSFVESRVEPNLKLTPVTTVIEINAPPEKVWKNVVEFPELAPPTEFLFKTGIAYPIKARIEGAGKGAIRYCEFSTGAFIEPIEVWDENKLLQFSVNEQPLPMRELSPYGNLDTPHLHDYFVSRKGQFKLTQLENGNTLLEGTTWYYHRIKPEFYWGLWTVQIVHTIHERVLSHIKEQSEKGL